ncbi:sugar kinase [Pseudodesulfovibrio portus]|uniref:2-dehydro-3-deoxygluconokinase n=1 Tax=Pseudodesulfovibrio portus TaxID=231439 RepID=A0ABM8AU33_9BACT|nr:sugar kinase [Pseudodesulfovibrio portus]BDQ35021.1 2-dehydro-3-deoxygluconokinase [Pseudodesulfovibrio portus]
MAATSIKSIISLGEPLIELSATDEGTLDTVSSFITGFGGDASNFAVAARRAGGDVSMLTQIGQDPFGDAFLNMWAKEGIDTSLVKRSAAGPTGIYFISRNSGSHYFTYYRSGSAASLMTPDLLPEVSIREARLLHVTGVTQGISDSACETSFAAMDIARQAGTLISYDPNYRPALWPMEKAVSVIEESVSRADIIFPSMEETEMLFGSIEPEAAVRKYLELGAGTVVLKLGTHGALLASGDGIKRIPAMRVNAVDASGAGDTFAGSFAAAYMENRPPEWCARFAVTAAGLSTTGFGCVTPIPARKDILSHMAPGPD